MKELLGSALNALSFALDCVADDENDKPEPFGSTQDMEKSGRKHLDSNLFETHSELSSSTGFRDVDNSSIKSDAVAHHESLTR